MQKIQMRALHHDDRLAQGNKGVRSTGQSNDAKPSTTLLKCRTVDEQNCPACKRQHCYKRQQDPQHPLSQPSVSSGSDLVIASSRHAGYNRCENGIEGLIDLAQAVRGPDDRAVDTDGCERHTGRASNKVGEDEEVQPGNERVNQLINADGNSIPDQKACFAKG